MWYEDLAKCDYLGEGLGKYLTAVGWLEKGKDFSTGSLPEKTYSKLLEFEKKYWMFFAHCGVHECDLCETKYKYGIELFRQSGSGEIFIPGNGKIYVYPKLLTHYINDHNYSPPKEFVKAVDSCPPMRSIRYFAKLIFYSGKIWVKTKIKGKTHPEGK